MAEYVVPPVEAAAVPIEPHFPSPVTALRISEARNSHSQSLSS